MREAGAQNRSLWAAPLPRPACCTTSAAARTDARFTAVKSSESRPICIPGSPPASLYSSLSFAPFLAGKHQLTQNGADFSALSKAHVALMTAESAYLTFLLFEKLEKNGDDCAPQRAQRPRYKNTIRTLFCLKKKNRMVPIIVKT